MSSAQQSARVADPTNKQKIINDIYFDRSGFGSRATTLKDARERGIKVLQKRTLRSFLERMLKKSANRVARIVL